MISRHKIITGIFISILCVVYYLTLPISIFKSLPMGDTPIFEYFGYAMTRGQLPYLDLFDHKGIFIFLAHYLGFSIYGEIGAKILFTICIFIFLYYVIKISLLIADKLLIALFTALIIFLNYMYISELGLNVETLVLPFITLSLYIYLKYFIEKKINNLEIIILGISFFITFFTRANMIAVWLLFSLVILIKCIKDKNYKFLIRYIGYFLVGILIVLIPVFIYVIKNNLLYEMLYQSFYVNFTYAGGSGIGKKNIILWFLKMIQEMNIILVSVVFFLFNNINNKKYLYIYIAITLVAVILALLSKRDYYHYLIVLLPFFVPYLAEVFQMIFDKLNIHCLKLFILLIGIYFVYKNSIDFIDNSITNRSEYNKNFNIVSNYIKDNTDVDDKIYTHRLTGAIYLQSERLASTKYFFIPSINEEIYYDDLKKDIEANNAKYIVIKESYLSIAKIDKFIVEYVDKNYVLEKEIDDFKIYKLEN